MSFALVDVSADGTQKRLSIRLSSGLVIYDTFVTLSEEIETRFCDGKRMLRLQKDESGATMRYIRLRADLTNANASVFGLSVSKVEWKISLFIFCYCSRIIKIQVSLLTFAVPRSTRRRQNSTWRLSMQRKRQQPLESPTRIRFVF